MTVEGGEFYLSRNGVWLTGPVEPRFLEAAFWAEGDLLWPVPRTSCTLPSGNVNRCCAGAIWRKTRRQRCAMFYNCVEFEDGTQVAFSNVLDGGEVQVSIERPVELDFDSALCVIPAFERTAVEGFDESDMTRLDSFIHNNSQLILRLARETSREYV